MRWKESKPRKERSAGDKVSRNATDEVFLTCENTSTYSVALRHAIVGFAPPSPQGEGFQADVPTICNGTVCRGVLRTPREARMKNGVRSQNAPARVSVQTVGARQTARGTTVKFICLFVDGVFGSDIYFFV